QLGTGEAVVTVLSERGAPTPVAWTMLRAPQSLMGASDPAVVEGAVASSAIGTAYAQALDRESAHEKLAARLATDPSAEQEELERAGREGPWPEETPAEKPAPRRSEPEEDSLIEKVVESSAFRS